ncbi:MAG: toll/interleukin-1 receptor domain-containing protein [Planctomycetes bacterium]|nr:toll/interleukin-1 receptor domain-containing protein [Planctomycetota bacterium]
MESKPKRIRRAGLPFPAYPGEPPDYRERRPYIFVSYAHADSARVYPDIKCLHDEGYRIWYDEGLPAGKEFGERLVQLIEECAQFLVYLSPESVQSKYVRKELGLADRCEAQILPILLEDVSLPRAFVLYLFELHYLPKYLYEDPAEYARRLRQDLLPETKAERAAGGEGAMPAVPAPVGGASARAETEDVELSTLLNVSTDQGTHWSALEVRDGDGRMPRGSILRVLVRCFVACHVALLIESRDRNDRVLTTEVFLPGTEGANRGEWREFEPLRWHVLPEAGGAKETEPDRTAAWRIGLLAVRDAPSAGRLGGEGSAGAEEVAAGGARRTALALAAAARPVEGCAKERIGLVQRTALGLGGGACEAEVLRAPGPVVRWIEVRFE